MIDVKCSKKTCKRPARPGKKLCVSCAESSHKTKSKRRSQAKQAGVCIVCVKHPTQNGRKVCDRCNKRQCDYGKRIKKTVHEFYGNRCNCPGCPETNPRRE